MVMENPEQLAGSIYYGQGGGTYLVKSPSAEEIGVALRTLDKCEEVVPVLVKWMEENGTQIWSFVPAVKVKGNDEEDESE